MMYKEFNLVFFAILLELSQIGLKSQHSGHSNALICLDPNYFDVAPAVCVYRCSCSGEG